jgi:hypothetical protein
LSFFAFFWFAGLSPKWTKSENGIKDFCSQIFPKDAQSAFLELVTKRVPSLTIFWRFEDDQKVVFFCIFLVRCFDPKIVQYREMELAIFAVKSFTDDGLT